MADWKNRLNLNEKENSLKVINNCKVNQKNNTFGNKL